MAKVCFISVAGLDGALLDSVPNLRVLKSCGARRVMKPVTPAVTSTMQATLTTGKLPGDHGIIANGLYTYHRAELESSLDLSSFPSFRKQVSFWEQSNDLLDCPRFWQGMGKRVGMMFWQQSMMGAADVVLTPKPTHSADGKTLTACWSAPADLYAELVAELGPFPLHQYWGPMAGLGSTRWIVEAARRVWDRGTLDLLLVYIPFMDYNLQRLGPNHPTIAKDLAELDAALEPLVAAVRKSDAEVIIAGDYGITEVNTALLPNQAFREAGLLHTTPDEQGKLLVDFDRSAAFAMVDHQIAHVYCRTGPHPEILRILSSVPGVDRVLHLPNELEALGLNHGRSGDVVALAKPNAWFAHDWWLSDQEKPAWQFSVDIHRKPGYDPRELFFNPAKKIIAQETSLVKGSHGFIGTDQSKWPVVLSGETAAWSHAELDATDVAGWLTTLLRS